MGNCLKSGGGDGMDDDQLMMRRRRGGGEEEDDQGSATSVLKVKMVLTKAELEWLMAQLKAGDRRTEDVLRDMARKRDARAGAGRDGWRPSLESIIECPEIIVNGAASFDG